MMVITMIIVINLSSTSSSVVVFFHCPSCSALQTLIVPNIPWLYLILGFCIWFFFSLEYPSLIYLEIFIDTTLWLTLKMYSEGHYSWMIFYSRLMSRVRNNSKTSFHSTAVTWQDCDTLLNLLQRNRIYPGECFE